VSLDVPRQASVFTTILVFKITALDVPASGGWSKSPDSIINLYIFLAWWFGGKIKDKPIPVPNGF
jgi:hypothetical protein